VSRLQLELQRLEVQHARAGAAAGQEVDTAVAAVSAQRSRLRVAPGPAWLVHVTADEGEPS
jgi:hypothetical protein